MSSTRFATASNRCSITDRSASTRSFLSRTLAIWSPIVCDSGIVETLLNVSMTMLASGTSRSGRSRGWVEAMTVGDGSTYTSARRTSTCDVRRRMAAIAASNGMLSSTPPSTKRRTMPFSSPGNRRR